MNNMKNILKRFNRTPQPILYVTSDGTTETAYRIECPANEVDKFLARPDIIAWRVDYRHSFDWHSDNWYEGEYNLWFSLYDKIPLKEKRHPLAHKHCILLMIDLKAGDKIEKQGTGEDLLIFAKSQNAPFTAWGLYRINYGYSGIKTLIADITFIECNTLWSPHYADRFGYVTDEATT